MDQDRVRRRAVSRRALLTSLGATAGVVWLGAAGDAPDSAPRRTLAAVVRPRPSAPPVPTPVPPPAPPAQRPMPPVHTLAEYRKAVPGPAFPPNAVALTIDDGPHPLWTPKVLDLLDR